MSIIKARGNKKTKKDSVTIILIAPNPGYRMKSCGPVSLLPLGDQFLIDIQIKAIQAIYKNYEIILCCGFEANKVAKYIKNKYKTTNIRLVENQLFETSSCCESLKLCLNNINTDSTIICNGEVLLFPELFKIRSESCYIVSQEKTPKKSSMDIGSVIDQNNIVTNISYNLPNIWSEVFYLNSKNTIEYMRKIVSSDFFSNKMIFEALNEFAKKHKLENIKIDHCANKLNDVKTYQKIKEIYESVGSKLFLRNNI